VAVRVERGCWIEGGLRFRESDESEGGGFGVYIVQVEEDPSLVFYAVKGWSKSQSSVGNLGSRGLVCRYSV
jgi:hypothetical protein